MFRLWCILLATVFSSVAMSAQTAEELVAKNLAAKGGIEKIKAIKSLRTVGKFQQGGITATLGEVAKAPNLLRNSLSLQGMNLIQAYDGSSGWQINPFEGRRDPELLGEDDLRDLVYQADFYGPLVDYKEKGNKVEYLGQDTVDGDDVYRLKVTLKNGDVTYYFLDPETFLEIRTETQHFIRGSVRESVTNYGNYKQVNGVYYAFALEQGSKNDPSSAAKINLEKIEANVPVDDQSFKMPTAKATPVEKGKN
jgi:outer membrane lipoprotein-sorting protein